jgi:hypothetical protein
MYSKICVQVSVVEVLRCTVGHKDTIPNMSHSEVFKKINGS